MVTPFLDGKINYPMMEQLLQRQFAAGITTVVIAGTTGEAATLTDEEKLALFARCKAYVGQSMQIIAGTGSNATEHTVYLSKEAEKLGVDGLLVVSPYYNKASRDGLIAHYKAVAEAVSLPVILYNVPSRTGVDIPVEVYRSLCRIPNIAGVKEATTSISKILRLRETCGDRLPIWAGNDDMATAVTALGGKGVISVASNVVPEWMDSMVAAALDGDFDTASALQISLQPLCDFLFSEVNPIPVKAALQRIGLDCGGCRLPLTSMQEVQMTEFEKIFSGIDEKVHGMFIK
jgi:4-hydroxy-tetrahydrodipicolinate synthase